MKQMYKVFFNGELWGQIEATVEEAHNFVKNDCPKYAECEIDNEKAELHITITFDTFAEYLKSAKK